MVDQTFSYFTSFLLVWFSLPQGVQDKGKYMLFHKEVTLLCVSVLILLNIFEILKEFTSL